jgi:hypothetical protein
MSDTTAFAPLYSVTGTNAGTLVGSVTLAATAASQAIQLPGNGSTQQIRVANQSAAWASINFGVFGATPAATVATGLPVAPGAVEVFGVASEVCGATCILASGTGSVTFTRGSGL